MYLVFVCEGYIESLDDYYQLSSGLVMLQTTNNVFNTELYNLVKPQSLFAWQRVRVANMMAHSGRQWYNTVRMYNSGMIESRMPCAVQWSVEWAWAICFAMIWSGARGNIARTAL